MISNFRNRVLLNPIAKEADRLKIVTGYATHTMASWHIKEIIEKFSSDIRKPIEITVLVGMCRYEGLNISTHNGFKQLAAESQNSDYVHLNVQYIYKGKAVHSKLYLWEKDGHPFRAYMGSANYTQTAFFERQREIMTTCDPEKASEYFDSVENDSIYCRHAEVEEYVVIHSDSPRFRVRKNKTPVFKGKEVNSVTLSFLTKKGIVGEKSGINWGQREGREPNQAYIPLPKSEAQKGFFPLEKQHFSALTDDGKQLILRVEQQGDKAITTPANNSLLGEYFRNRLGLANGAFVTKADFERYGRSDVTFYKLDDEQFYMDFSVTDENS